KPCCRGLEVLTIEGPAYFKHFLDRILIPVPVRSSRREAVLSNDGSIKGRKQDRVMVPSLNKLLKMLPNLVQFTLDYGLTDLAIFNGMGRIPILELQSSHLHYHHQQEKEEERVDGISTTLAVIQRPLLETLKIALTSPTLTDDDAKARLHTRFPDLAQLTIRRV
ncbi:hypothetical protein BGX33_008258, partial [Mortierella sp. NVP41]